MDIADITPYEAPGSLLRNRSAQPSLHGQTEVVDANRTKRVNPYDNVRESQAEPGEERRYLNIGEMREHERMSSCKWYRSWLVGGCLCICNLSKRKSRA